MKSAYELAMERMEKSSGPTQKLTAKQKTEIAEIEKKYEAKAAAVKLDLEGKIGGFESDGAFAEAQELKGQLAQELTRFSEKREEEKEKVWESDGS